MKYTRIKKAWFHNLKAVKIFKIVFLLSLFLLWLICFLALDDSPLLKLQQKQFIISSPSLLSHLNILEVFECPEAPDEPEEPDDGPGHAHVVEALRDCLALAPGRLALATCHLLPLLLTT